MKIAIRGKLVNFLSSYDKWIALLIIPAHLQNISFEKNIVWLRILLPALTIVWLQSAHVLLALLHLSLLPVVCNNREIYDWDRKNH